MKFISSIRSKRGICSLVACMTMISGTTAAPLGGMTTATNTASEIQTGIFAFVGVVAIIYLIWLGVMAFSDKKSWADFGFGVVHVAVVGGAVKLATWAWTVFA